MEGQQGRQAASSTGRQRSFTDVPVSVSMLDAIEQGACAATAAALQAGADVVVQSTHKQLSAMTQAAMLHAQGSRVSRTKLARALQVCGVESVPPAPAGAGCTAGLWAPLWAQIGRT